MHGRQYRLCSNYAQYQVCNWMVSPEDMGDRCRACRHDETIPDLSVPANIDYWARLELSKRRLFYSLIKLNLPFETKAENPTGGLSFRFLADPDSDFSESSKVMTGHVNGVITLNVAEADDAARERLRLAMNERYRTVLGHFRHEIGHYYWERLGSGTPHHQPFRELFGDERQDYDAALKRHYQEGPPLDWQQSFVSTYASSHPWEDWAESWAHYLHMVDTLETARDLHLSLGSGGVDCNPILRSSGPYSPSDFDVMVAAWLPLTEAINSLNRSMGHPDSYPFVLSEPALRKVRFAHNFMGHTNAPASTNL